ncbi:hypothetical protein E3U23_11280 [Erythrobacter litoralis]|uniref:hypothetical protein n=1 Tax=Erythrobacter litoralis TaxID=39960 RepID=UPI0024357D09|nr:hypothetical protein [Erythrobacter litoralis]MDG6079771.1 hypothetical protein [Erythrobacter litoralis]
MAKPMNATIVAMTTIKPPSQSRVAASDFRFFAIAFSTLNGIARRFPESKHAISAQALSYSRLSPYVPT